MNDSNLLQIQKMENFTQPHLNDDNKYNDRWIQVEEENYVNENKNSIYSKLQNNISQNSHNISQFQENQVINIQRACINPIEDLCLTELEVKEKLKKGIYLAQKQENTLNDLSKLLTNNNYFIEKYLKSGGQSDIFLGKQINQDNDTEIIIKIYSQIDKKNFEQELEIINLIKNPINIVKVLNYLLLDEHNIYILIQERHKCSLNQELKYLVVKNKFSLKKLCQIIYCSLDGLIEFKSYEITHQDIKKQNIVKTFSGFFIYCDLGSASIRKNDSFNISRWQTEKSISPEHRNGEKIGYYSDVYSLGLTLKDVLELFQKINSQNQIYIQIARQFLDIVQQKMIQAQINEREEIMELLLIFVQIINQTNEQKIKVWYNKKISKIIDLDPFNNDKDIHYFSFVHLQYNLIHLHTQLNIYYHLQIDIDKIKLNLDQIQNLSNIDFLLVTSLQNVGHCYYKLGYYERAYDFFQQSLQMNKKFFKEKRSSIADSWNQVGQCEEKLGRFEQALDSYKKSESINQTISQGINIANANSYNNIGKCLMSLGRYKESQQYLQKSLERNIIIFQGIDSAIADSLDNLGQCYQKQGQFQIAEDFLLQSLNMKKMIFKRNHSVIADSLKYVGLFYIQQGKYRKALNFCIESLLMNRIIFKGNHPAIADSLSSIGQCYDKIGSFDIALKYQKKSLEINKKMFKGNHPSIADSLSSIGLCYDKIGQFSMALKYQQESLDMKKKIFKCNHPAIADSLSSIGLCYKKIGQFSMALAFQFESLIMNKKIFEGNHPTIADSLKNVGLCYYNLGKLEEEKKFMLQYIYMKDFCEKENKNIQSCYKQGNNDKFVEFQEKSAQKNSLIFKGQPSLFQFIYQNLLILLVIMIINLFLNSLQIL